MTFPQEPGYYKFESDAASIEVTVTEGDPLLPRPWPEPVDQSDTAAEWMAPELYEAWQYLQRDLAGSDAIMPMVAEHNWDGSGIQVTAVVWWPDGGGQGISTLKDAPLSERVAYLAEGVQEAEVEALWAAGRSAVWPHCPKHPNSHPLQPEVRDGLAVWTCADAEVIAPIGHLG